VTTSKELTTKASSNSEALFFVLPLRVSAGRVVQQRQRDRLEKKKNAITRLLSQVVVRFAERLRNAQHFGKEQNRERGFCRGNRTVRVALAGRAYRYSWGKRKVGIPGFCHITLQGGCAASSHRRFGKEVKTAYGAFVAKSCRRLRFPDVRDLEKKKKSRTRLLCRYSVPVAQKWGYQSGTRSQESEGAVASMGGKAFGYRWSEARFSVPIPARSD
jgi:hypothetical protein